jgi:hypothetical protein
VLHQCTAVACHGGVSQGFDVPKLPPSAESQAYWAASGAARDAREGLLHAAGGDGAGFGFDGMPNGGGGDWMLFKHNSCEDVDMAVDEAMQVTGLLYTPVLHSRPSCLQLLQQTQWK